ncbi:MAG: hypothetical protein ACRC2R_12730 [Xenococcaceae cyanobacterium]
MSDRVRVLICFISSNSQQIIQKGKILISDLTQLLEAEKFHNW